MCIWAIYIRAFFILNLIIFIACSLKKSQNFFIQFLALTSCLFSILLKEHIVDIEKPDGLCSLAFVVDELPGLFLHPSVFSIIHSRSAKIIIGALSKLWHWLNSNVSHCVKSVRIRSYSVPCFSAFGLNTERYGVSLRIHSKCGKMQNKTRTLFTKC